MPNIWLNIWLKSLNSIPSRVKHSWLPFKEDSELRRLPAFKALATVYRPLIEQGKKILPPVDHKAVENEANAIINEISTHLIGER